MNRIGYLLLILVFVFTGAGCWDVKDIGSRAFVTGIGIDAAEPGSGSKYKIVFVIPNPSKIKNRSAEIITAVHEIEADSLAQAVEKLQERISRQVTLTHLSVLLIGEKAAKNNFSHLASYFRKNSEIALRFGLQFVQNSQSKDIYTNKPQLDRSITVELVSMAQQERYNSLVRTREFQKFSQDLLSNKGVALGTRVYLAKEDNKKVTVRGGGAVFKNWHLAGWLDDYETQAANWFLGKSQATVIGKLGTSTFSYIVDDKSLKIKPATKDGKLKFLVKLKTDGNIVEQQGSGFDLKKPEDTKKVEKMFSETIRKQLADAVYKSQKEFGADYLGFGKSLKHSDSKLFKKLDWTELFPEIPVIIEVDAHISRFGVGD